MSVRHKVSICCSPPDMTPAGASALSLSRGKMAYMSSMLQRPCCRELFIPSNRFCFTVNEGKISRFSGT